MMSKKDIVNYMVAYCYVYGQDVCFKNIRNQYSHDKNTTENINYYINRFNNSKIGIKYKEIRKNGKEIIDKKLNNESRNKIMSIIDRLEKINAAYDYYTWKQEMIKLINGEVPVQIKPIMDF